MNFEFSMDLAKAEEINGKFYLEGIASTNDADSDNDIISSNAIFEMAKSAVGLDVTRSHAADICDSIGNIIQAEAQDNNSKLWIRAELDPEDSDAMKAYKKISKGAKAAWSIGGNIGAIGKSQGKTRVIESVKLDHVMLTLRPKNSATFAVALKKSLDTIEETTKMTLEEMLVNEQVKAHIESEVEKAVELAKSKATEELVKAGAKFSAETIGVLNDIATAGDDNVKAMIAKLLSTDVPGAPEEQEDAASQSIGVEKSEPIDIAALTKSITDAIKIELAANNQEIGKGNPLASNVKKPMFDSIPSLGEALRNLFG
jgi:hypothetical protein